MIIGTVGGSKTTLPSIEDAEALEKWNMKAGKAMYVLKTVVTKRFWGL